MAISIKDVAERAQVARSTVSYVLNNGPKNVTPELRSRVLKAMEELEYRPSGIARRMKSSATKTIGLPPGVVKPGSQMTIFMERMIAGLIEEASEASLDVLVLSGSRELVGRDLARSVLDQRADSLVFLDIDIQAAAIELAWKERIPHVVLMGVPATPSPYVLLDNSQGTQLALDHLYELGHRKIAHIHGQRGDRDAEARLSGFHEFMWSKRLPIIERWVDGGDFRPDEAEKTGYEAAGRIFSSAPYPTAIFSANDAMVPGIFRRLAELGLSVPGDVSIVGYDDSWQCMSLDPRLTTVHQDFAGVGRMAVRAILDFDPEAMASSPLLYPVHLVVRGTTSAVKQRKLR